MRTPTTSILRETEMDLWTPPVHSAFQIQLSDYPPDLDAHADIFELDLFEVTRDDIRYLHDQGKKVICYFNAGAWEEFRPDAGDFPPSVIGNLYIGWPGEKWLDISRYEDFSGLMISRINLAAEKGCDGIDPDNVNAYQHKSGFDITAQDQFIYNRWLADQAHAHGLTIGLKNNGGQVKDLVNHFDFAVLEDCSIFNECNLFLPFIEQSKAVFQIEYTDHYESLASLCKGDRISDFNILLKNRSLDAFVQYYNK